METINVYIRPGQSYSNPIEYTLKLIANQQNISFNFISGKAESTLIFDHDSKDESICISFYDALRHKNYDMPEHIVRHGQVISDSGKVDLLASIFYMINCIQEINPKISEVDRFGRFRFERSFQYKDDSITENKTQHLIRQYLKSNGIEPRVEKSKIFVSHDVDFMYGSKSEDFKWAMRSGSFGAMMKIIFNECIKRPHWRNIDRVLSMNDTHDIKSTFFWLVNDGVGADDIPNADYNLKHEKDLIELVESSSGINGLHKSSSEESINQEIDKAGKDWKYNRYHYLRFNTHTAWRSISKSKIKVDCSLGFAEHYGFRNSYGKPFTPFNLEDNEPYNFVETPLHVMDATFLHYLKTDPDKIGSTIVDFIEKNKMDCVLSILWHNNYLTDYAYGPFLKAYKEIIGYIYENKFETIDPDAILDQYLLTDDEIS